MGSREVARRFQTSHQTINRMRQRYRQIGLFKNRPRSGRPKVTTRPEDLYVTNIVARNRFVTRPETRHRLYAARGPGVRPVSVQTLRNRIHASGFKSRVPAKKPELSQRHKNARMAFSHAYVGWNNPQWRRVMFFDESMFHLKRMDGMKRVWRRRRERETCSSHSYPDSSLSRGRSHVVGRDFSDCKDRPGVHRRKPECTTLHQRSPYATSAVVSASDACRLYNFPGWQRHASSSAHCRWLLAAVGPREQKWLARDVPRFIMCRACLGCSR